MQRDTPQTETWSGDFGREYTDRNPQTPAEMDALYESNFGLTRSALNEDFLGGLDRASRILEVGANVGTQLQALQEMGFGELYGVELQGYAVELSKERTHGINLICGSAFDIPYKDQYFDLVYTSGVLIHISPADMGSALAEIHRCTRQFIWGYEYFADEHEYIPYRGRDDLAWKANFAQLYQDRFPELELVKERRIRYLQGENCDSMYMLRKP